MKILIKILLVLALAGGVAHADTPLIEAIRSENYDEAIRLIEDGADVNFGDSNDATPLHWTAYANAFNLANLLISKGADVDAKSVGDRTPLLWTAIKNSTEVAELLISKGADINVKDKDSLMPLHLAVLNRATGTINVLLDSGADVNDKSSLGITVLCMAKLKGLTEMASILKRAGAVAERDEPYPVDDSASQTNLITSAVNAAAMVAIVDEDNITETGAAAGQAVIDLSNASTARSKAKRAREKWERCEN